MATDFWASSHYKRWIVDRATLRQARSEDLEYVDDREHLDFLEIFFANVITKLGKKLQLRQRVIATATVFFRRFYLKNAYCETDPFFVMSACVYVAAKAEESSVHIKNVISESRSLFSQTYGIKTFPSDNSKLAEMEFYLVDDLECDMVVYHPYRTLLALCKKDISPSGSSSTASVFEGSNEEGEEGEAEEVGEVVNEAPSAAGTGIGSEDGPRYWGSGQGKLVLSEAALQTAWSIINDTYRSELCLLYPPHLIAIAALYLTFILHPPEKTTSKGNGGSSSVANSQDDKPQPRRSSRQASNNSSNINFSALATVGHTISAASLTGTSSLSKFKPPPSLPAKPVTSYSNNLNTLSASHSHSSSGISSNPSTTASGSGSSNGSGANTNPDPITFLAQLNVSLPLIATIAQEIISLYTLWDRYKEDGTPEASSQGITITSLSSGAISRSSSFNDSGNGNGKSKGKARSKSGIPINVKDDGSAGKGPSTVDTNATPVASQPPQTELEAGEVPSSGQPITPSFLLQVLMSMRQARLLDLALGGEGELLGLPPSAASAAAIAGHSAIGGGSGGYGQGDQQGVHMNMGYSTGSQMGVMGGMQHQGGQIYAPINKMLERTMNAGYG